MKYSLRTVSICLIMFTSSCNPYGLTKISVLMPGRYSIPPEVRSVSLALTKHEYNMPFGKLDSINNLKLDPQFNYHKLVYDYLYGMRSMMEQSPKFNRITISDHSKLNSIETGININWNEIVRICRTDSTDALLLIYNYYLLDSLNIISTDLSCYVEYILDNHLSFLILYPKMQQVAGKYSYRHKISSSEYGYEDCNTVLNYLPDGGDMIVQSCYETGQLAVESLVPLWVDNINRIYYLRGNKLMREGAFYAKKNLWLEAAEYWRQAVVSDKKNISAKAAFNMALVCEIEDKPELAGNWIELSDSIKRTKLSEQYKKILVSRIKHRNILDEQLIIEE